MPHGNKKSGKDVLGSRTVKSSAKKGIVPRWLVKKAVKKVSEKRKLEVIKGLLKRGG